MNLANKFHTVNHNKLRLIRRLTVDVTTKATEIVGLDIKVSLIQTKVDAYKHKIIIAETLIDQSILTKIPHHRIRLNFI